MPWSASLTGARARARASPERGGRWQSPGGGVGAAPEAPSHTRSPSLRPKDVPTGRRAQVTYEDMSKDAPDSTVGGSGDTETTVGLLPGD